MNVSVIFIKHNQNYYLKFDVAISIRGLHQMKLVLSSSGFWHYGKTPSPCQESGRMCMWLSWKLPSSRFMACFPSFRMCMASLIHLVKLSGSLSITVAWDQLMTWFSSVAWSVRADLLCSVKLDAWRLRPTHPKGRTTGHEPWWGYQRKDYVRQKIKR